MVDPVLSDCVVAYIGTIGRNGPEDPEERALRIVGPAAIDLLPVVRALVDQIVESRGEFWGARDLRAMGDAVEARLKDCHPELSDAARSALANQAAFWWR